MRQSVQEWTKQILWKTAFKKFEGCLPQNLLSPLLNTLSYIYSSTYAAEKALPHKQKILLIWDSLKTQSTTKLEDTYASYGIETVMVPKNMTHLL